MDPLFQSLAVHLMALSVGQLFHHISNLESGIAVLKAAVLSILMSPCCFGAVGVLDVILFFLCSTSSQRSWLCIVDIATGR